MISDLLTNPYLILLVINSFINKPIVMQFDIDNLNESKLNWKLIDSKLSLRNRFLWKNKASQYIHWTKYFQNYYFDREIDALN